METTARGTGSRLLLLFSCMRHSGIRRVCSCISLCPVWERGWTTTAATTSVCQKRRNNCQRQPPQPRVSCQCTSCNDGRRCTPIDDVVYDPSTYGGDKSIAARRMKCETVVGASWLTWSGLDSWSIDKHWIASYDPLITTQKGGCHWVTTNTTRTDPLTELDVVYSARPTTLQDVAQVNVKCVRTCVRSPMCPISKIDKILRSAPAYTVRSPISLLNPATVFPP